MDIKNNRELYNFLVSLSEHFEASGESDLAQDLNSTSHFIIGSPSEFLYEAKVVLQKLIEQNLSILSSQQLNAAKLAIASIDKAFHTVGDVPQ